MGSKSNRAISWKSENQDVMGIANIICKACENGMDKYDTLQLKCLLAPLMIALLECWFLQHRFLLQTLHIYHCDCGL